MKIHRNKKFKKIIQYYKNNFGFREPFQILVDATFCFTALKVKLKSINYLFIHKHNIILNTSKTHIILYITYKFIDSLYRTR